MTGMRYGGIANGIRNGTLRMMHSKENRESIKSEENKGREAERYQIAHIVAITMPFALSKSNVER